MKFQICTTNKTIQIVDECKLIDFITQIKAMLPDWEDYTITSKMGEQFLNPIIIEKWNPTTNPVVYPTTYPHPLTNPDIFYNIS